MKLEEMFWHGLDKRMAVEIIKKLKKTYAWKGVKKTDLEIYLRDTLETTHIFYNIDGVINKLREEGYVERKKFNWKDYKKDGDKEIPRYYLSKKGKKLYKEIC